MEKFRLAGTDQHVRVDWDTTHLSFGPDTSEIHCWSCTTADMRGGAWITRKPLADGRSTWDDFEDRYNYPSPEATKSLICIDCAIKHDINAKQLLTVEQRAATRPRRSATTRAGSSPR